MEGRSVESQAAKSEPEAGTADNNVELCEHRSVKREAVDGASFSDLTDPGGDRPAPPTEGMFEFDAVKSEETPHATSRLVQSAGEEQVTAHTVKDECEIYDPFLEQDPLDTTPETAQTSSPDHKSPVHVIIPTDSVEVRPGADCPSRSEGRGSPRKAKAPRADKKSPGGRRRRGNAAERADKRPRSRPRSSTLADARRKYGEVAAAKLELVELQIAIARKKLEGMRGGGRRSELTRRRSSVEEAKARLRALKGRYERRLEKDKLRAEISRIDAEIQKCIATKKRARREGGPATAQ